MRGAWLVLFYLLLAVTGTASSSLTLRSRRDKLEMVEGGERDEASRNITVGSFSGGARRARQKRRMRTRRKPRGGNDELQPLECQMMSRSDTSSTSFTDSIRDATSKQAKETRVKYERLVTHIISIAREECMALGFMGEIEFQSTYCLFGQSYMLGSWTQVDYLSRPNENKPGGQEEEPEDDLFTSSIKKAVVSAIQTALSDMAERASIWEESETLANTARDSAITRSLAIGEPFAGLFQVLIYFRVWLDSNYYLHHLDGEGGRRESLTRPHSKN